VQFINEPARKTKVFREVDVVVIGGGPGGVASAISAARNGARTVLVERYGHLGGMATGGLINIIPNIGDSGGTQRIYGITQEILNRLDKRGGTSYPPKADWGTADKDKVEYYRDAGMSWFFLRNDAAGQARLHYSAVVDPEIMKEELNTMVLESGAELLLHSWGTQAILENNQVKGVIFESKSGRQALLGKVIIDSTGDGDIFLSAGAEYDHKLDNKRRTAWLASTWWVTNVNLKKYDEFKKSQPDKYKEVVQDLAQKGGAPGFFKSVLKNIPNTVWFHGMMPQPEGPTDAMDMEQLTRMDIKGRKRCLITYEYMKKNMPGFEKSFIMLTAPQLGTQGGRRIIGEYWLNEKDMETDEVFEDTIAVLANNDYGAISHKHPALCIPYRCLVPKKVDGLLVGCRAFSCSDTINETFNIIPHCLCYGQAAGTAAALAVKSGIEPRKVDYKILQDNLRKQGVNIPEGNEIKLSAKKKTSQPADSYYQQYKGA
jgi:2-polyprenyl-6-methoxyphenol hydroxylase-like FAD-dependent oxidoreductase